MMIEQVKDISPVEAFLAMQSLGRPFLFSGSAATGARYSYAGAGPVSEVVCRDGEDPFKAVSRALAGPADEGPFPFNSGVVGYFSYDLKDMIEPGRGFRKKPGPDIPLFMAALYDPVFVFDHRENAGYLVSRSSSPERFAHYLNLVRAGAGCGAGAAPKAARACSDTTRDEYIAAVLKAKEYIAAGDIYQINLSHRILVEWLGEPFSLYARLLETHPAPMSSYLDLGAFQLISNSPECLLRVAGGVAETCPIKGTRRRGASGAEDAFLVGELLESRKERAEHVMIVDLERSDLGKVSVAGSVEVASFEAIATYPHLHHMVSTVRGALRPGVDAAGALKALFPGGSITGAPKVRAMEIIDELERSARAIYTGGIGWFDPAGSAEVSVAIRTAVCAGGLLTLGVGGGIVADSVPEDEFDETMLKARDFFAALGVER